MIQERGDRGAKFDSRNHSEIDASRMNVTLEDNTRGTLFRNDFIPKTAFQRGHNSVSSARFSASWTQIEVKLLMLSLTTLILLRLLNATFSLYGLLEASSICFIKYRGRLRKSR